MLNIKTKLRRAFTIVELVVVIAVIAALAAILIPTFANVINAANESADTSLVKNLNTILTSEETLNSCEATTMSEALEWAESNGYSVDKLTPTSAGDILWNQTTNRFVLVNSDGKIIYSDDSTTETLGATYWKIAHAESEVNSKYSTYYAADYEGTVNGTISNVGIDVSALTEKVDITYTGDNGTTADTIIINGNGGAFSVNDTNKVDEIKVYNVSASLTGTSLASNSLHLYGTVTGTITISSGRFVLEDTAVINTKAVVIPESATEDVVVVNNTSTTVTVFNASTKNVTTSGSGKTETKKDDYSKYYALVGDSYYTTFADAVSAAKTSAETVMLLQNVTLTASGDFSSELYLSSGNLTVDLNGKTISGGSIIYPVYVASGASLTVNDTLGDGKIETGGTYGIYVLGTFNMNGGAIDSTDSSAAVFIWGGIINTTGGSIVTTSKNALWLYEAQSATLNNLTVNTEYTDWGYGIYCSSCTGAINMTNVTIDAGAYCCGVALLTYSSATMTDCNITSNGWYCIANNGADSEVSLTINGGTYLATDCTALYLPNYNAKTVVSNAEITGAEGIEIRGGYLTLNNCTVTGTNSSYIYQSNGSGNTVYGSALAISQHTTKEIIQVIINGGTYTAYNGPAITQNNLNSATDDDLAKITLTINGATISGNHDNGDIYLENESKINYSKS